MKPWLLLALAALLAVVGAVWTLQGLDVLGGSPMSGETVWAIIGPVVVIVAAVLAVLGVRALRRQD